MSKFALLLLFCSLLSGVIATADRLGCRDEAGNMVDWFYLYKLPNKFDGESEQENVEQSNSGLNYLFITPSSTQWVLSNRLINQTDSMPGRSLSPAYLNNADNFVLMYNDEPPNGKTDGTRGHTKGVVIANDISGLWLVHSVPKYPPPVEDGRYDYPHTGTLYGQSFLCISFTAEQVEKVGKQLQFNEPHFYSSHVPEYLKTIYPDFVEALEMKPVKTAPYFRTQEMQSRSKSKFVSFAKSRQFQKELYADLVAPHYAAGDYFVETWRHGPGNLDSNCKQPSKVYNIEELSFASANVTFKTLRDHSKWMVSSEHKLICVGDINRQEHQKVRGGGTVCQETKLSSAYSSLIKAVEKCKKVKKQVRFSNKVDEIVYS